MNGKYLTALLRGALLWERGLHIVGMLTLEKAVTQMTARQVDTALGSLPDLRLEKRKAGVATLWGVWWGPVAAIAEVPRGG